MNIDQNSMLTFDKNEILSHAGYAEFSGIQSLLAEGCLSLSSGFIFSLSGLFCLFRTFGSFFFCMCLFGFHIPTLLHFAFLSCRKVFLSFCNFLFGFFSPTCTRAIAAHIIPWLVSYASEGGGVPPTTFEESHRNSGISSLTSPDAIYMPTANNWRDSLGLYIVMYLCIFGVYVAKHYSTT